MESKFAVKFFEITNSRWNSLIHLITSLFLLVNTFKLLIIATFNYCSIFDFSSRRKFSGKYTYMDWYNNNSNL